MVNMDRQGVTERTTVGLPSVVVENVRDDVVEEVDGSRREGRSK